MNDLDEMMSRDDDDELIHMNEENGELKEENDENLCETTKLLEGKLIQMKKK